MPRLNGPVRFRGGGFSPRDNAWASAGTLLGLVALWQLGASAGLIKSLFLPPPAAICAALYHLAISGELWRHLSASLMRLGIGWISGTIFGIGMGLAGERNADHSPTASPMPIPKIVPDIQPMPSRINDAERCRQSSPLIAK